MKKELEVFVPQILKDVATELHNPNNNENQRQAYRLRLECARDFCNEALTSNEQFKPVQPVTKKHYSRIGAGNYERLK